MYQKMNDLRLVIFDLDGTLVDAYKAVASSLNYALNQTGHASVNDALIKRTVGWGDRHLVETFAEEHKVTKVLTKFREHHEEALKSSTVFLPGARELLDTLKTRKVTLSVASNRPSRFTHIILEHLGIEDIFDYVLCGDQVEHPKPAADILNQTLKRFSLNPDQALYVGDMTIDVQTGQAAGVKTVVVVTGSNTKEEVAGFKPHAILDCVAQVDKIVANLAV